MKIGILSLQGAFLEHEIKCAKLGVVCFEIRNKGYLKTGFDGLFIPGGESTVIGKLLRELDLFDIMRGMIGDGLPVFGTCAGMILLAKNILNDDRLYLATMDITVKRNAYGRQRDSFYTVGDFAGYGKIPMTFIRAPYIESAAAETEILAVVDNKIVAARQKNQLVTAFHPELHEDTCVHEYFFNMF